MENIDDLIGKVFNLAELVSYQDGAVVSRTVIKQDKGNITLFSFDKGQGLSEHTAPFDALVYAVDGEVEVTIAGEVHNLKKGDMIIMPADKPHSLKALDKFKMLLVMIRS